jgi:hypothetical protein
MWVDLIIEYLGGSIWTSAHLFKGIGTAPLLSLAGTRVVDWSATIFRESSFILCLDWPCGILIIFK